MERRKMSQEHLLQNSQALLYWGLDLLAAEEKSLKSLTNQWGQKIAAKQISLISNQASKFRVNQKLVKRQSLVSQH